MILEDKKTVFVTGGAGFIGSALVRMMISQTDYCVVNIDCLTYAGNLASLDSVSDSDSDRYFFEQVDICDTEKIAGLFKKYRPAGVIHLAAESHVDRSIDGPAEFINTNITGTFTLLSEARNYYLGLNENDQADFRFLHVSTDEVYGSLGKTGLFTEETAYDPRSPYSASKAASDHLARAWFHTYNFPVLITNCSNNYGPYQFPEKLIPVVILKALAGENIPIYGDGKNIRDWLFVEDHVEALLRVFEKGSAGETYNIGGHNEKTNLDVVHTICNHLDELRPSAKPYADQIVFVTDRPGHDRRYAIDASKIANKLDWKPKLTFSEGIKQTVQWYLDHSKWCDDILSGAYKLERLGTERQ